MASEVFSAKEKNVNPLNSIGGISMRTRAFAYRNPQNEDLANMSTYDLDEAIHYRANNIIDQYPNMTQAQQRRLRRAIRNMRDRAYYNTI